MYRTVVAGARNIKPGAIIQLTPDDISNLLSAHLQNDAQWQDFLLRKPHIKYNLHANMTNLMARYISWYYYPDITS